MNIAVYTMILKMSVTSNGSVLVMNGFMTFDMVIDFGAIPLAVFMHHLLIHH